MFKLIITRREIEPDFLRLEGNLRFFLKIRYDIWLMLREQLESAGSKIEIPVSAQDQEGLIHFLSKAGVDCSVEEYEPNEPVPLWLLQPEAPNPVEMFFVFHKIPLPSREVDSDFLSHDEMRLRDLIRWFAWESRYHLELAAIELTNGHPDEAVASCNQAITLIKEELLSKPRQRKYAQLAYVYYLMGQIYAQINLKPTAKEYFECADQLNIQQNQIYGSTIPMFGRDTDKDASRTERTTQPKNHISLIENIQITA